MATRHALKGAVRERPKGRTTYKERATNGLRGYLSIDGVKEPAELAVEGAVGRTPSARSCEDGHHIEILSGYGEVLYKVFVNPV